MVSLTDAIDTTSPGGMLAFHMLGAIAEFERALIRERTTAGLAEARRKGRVGGRPRLMEAKDVAGTRAMLADGALTSKEVAARFQRVKSHALQALIPAAFMSDRHVPSFACR